MHSFQRIVSVAMLCMVLTSCGLPQTALATAPREVSTLQTLSFPPEFATENDTTLVPSEVGHRALDPVELAQLAWRGYVQKNPEPWPDLDPNALRFFFDCRALPWPSLKHHVVDGSDVGMRTMGVHAKLHEMLGAEKENDPAEAGTLLYLLDVTDQGPDSCLNTWLSWLDGRPDTTQKSCPLAEGMGCRNMKMLYEATGETFYRDWSLNILNSLEIFAHPYTQDGRPTATYCWNAYNVCGPYCPTTECPTGDCGYLFTGWLCYITGWNARAFSEWYEVNQDPDTLAFAVRLANRSCYTQANGNDGAFNPDGSFGGTDPANYSGAWHVHAHTFIVPGLAHLGGQLIRAGQREAGVAFITRAQNIFEFLFDASRNPDAGSWTGWLPEWLQRTMGWPGLPDCEGCCTGDALEIAVALAEAGLTDPDLAYLVDYYDAAERFFTGQLIEGTFQVSPEYQQVLRQNLTIKVQNEMPGATAEQKALEVEEQYQQALLDADRLTGQQMGHCGFPDKINHLATDLPGGSGLPAIHMMGCCASATVRGAHAIWKHTVTGDESQARVNLAVNRNSPLLTVISSLPRRGEVNILVKTAEKVLVRIPAWVSPGNVQAYKNRLECPVVWDTTGKYIVFDSVSTSDQLTVIYPLRIAEVRETINGTLYTERWRGNTITNIDPAGILLPMYQRPECGDWGYYDTDINQNCYVNLQDFPAFVASFEDLIVFVQDWLKCTDPAGLGCENLSGSGGENQDTIPAGCVLWLKADSGVISDATGVATWKDQSGNLHHASRVKGTMYHTTRTFGNGSHDVIRFNKDGFFSVLYGGSLNVQDLTVYAVVQQTGTERRGYYSNYSNAVNWGYGYHLDMEGGSTRAFTSAGTSASYSDWLISGPSAGMHYLTTQISGSTKFKRIYSDGNPLGSTAISAIAYHTTNAVSVGALGQLDINTFFFRGDIAEIIVYPSVNDTQRSAIEQYLRTKYINPK